MTYVLKLLEKLLYKKKKQKKCEQRFHMKRLSFFWVKSTVLDGVHEERFANFPYAGWCGMPKYFF